MRTTEKVLLSLQKCSETSLKEPSFLLMDDESYFTLKLEYFGSVDAAIELELEEFEGLRVFHNNIGNTFIHVD